MQSLKYRIVEREIYITLLIIFKNTLPRDMVNHIMSYVKTKPTVNTVTKKININSKNKNNTNDNPINTVIKQKFNKGIKEIAHNINKKITKGAYNLINSMISAFIVKMVDTSIYLAQHCRNRTITSREIQTAIRIYPKDNTCNFTAIMVANGTRCVTRFNAEYVGYNEKNKRHNNRVDSGLKLHPSKIKHIMKDYVTKLNIKEDITIRIGVGSYIYLGGVLDKIVEEILTSSNKYQTSKKTISTDSVINGCGSNTTLRLLFCELFI